MDNLERPYNPVITIIADDFSQGGSPKEITIDLTKESSASLEDLSKVHPEAFYEIFWRAFSGVSDK